MADQFVQRMKSRTHARQNRLGLVTTSDKENSTASVSDKSINSTISGSAVKRNSKTTNLDNVQKSSIKYESEEASRAPLVTAQSLHSLSATSLSPNKASDSILNASTNITSSRSRFQHLTERTKQMQQWEDDYTYHSVCGGIFKEVENSDLGVHEASSVSVAGSNMLHDIKKISGISSMEKISSEIDKSILSTYYFGDFHTPDEYKLCGCDKSAKDKSICLFHSSYTPHHVADASYHTAYSSSPHSDTSLVNSNCASHSNTNFKSTPSPTSKAVSPILVTPTRRLAWDKKLLKSLEAQGFTPSPSRSKLAYDYRDRSPIKEKELSTSKSISKDSICNKSVATDRPELPKIVGVHEKRGVQQNSATVTKNQSSKSLEDKESNHVSGLRNQWEQHIREASPERQILQRCHSPSPERNFKPSHFSRERISPSRDSPGPTNSQRERSASPSKSGYLSNSTKIPEVPTVHGFNRGSVARTSYRSISPHKPAPCGEIVKSDIAMPETVPVVANPAAASVRERAAAFASLAGKGVLDKDPAELTLKDRLKLFEKKKGTALIPKAPFGQCVSGKVLKSNPEEGKLTELGTKQIESNRPNKFEETSVSLHSVVAGKSPVKLSLVDAQRKRFENVKDNWRETDINSKVLNQRDNDMQVLYNRFRRTPNSVSHKSKVSSESDSEYPESDDSSIEVEVLISNASRGAMGPPKPPRAFVDTSPSKEFLHSLPAGSPKSPSKRLNSTELDESYNRSPRKEYVPKIKPGCLFPSLSDIETQSETAESDEDVKNLSFAESVLTCASGESLGTQIQKMAQRSCGVSTVPQLSAIEEDTKRSSLQSSLSTSTLDALEAIDEALDQAFEEEEEDEPTPPKRGRKESEDDGGNSVYKTPKLCQSSSNSQNSADISLAHSISMYRKQKPADVVVTPIRQIMRKPDLCSPSKDSPVSPSVTITSRIRALQEEEEHQLKVISQASSAISVVTQHPEQHGTIQHVEAEKLLLMAAQKRQCAVHEIQRLKAEGALGKRDYWTQEDDSCRGSISISSITLPLKSDFLSKLNGQSIHHFVVLVKHRDQVITSELQATPGCIVEGAITFPNLMALYGLTADFNISLEVYAFRVEPLAHAGIKKDHSRMRLTPLKRLQKEAKSFSPVMSSPGGPYSIRSTSFSLIGFANLNINTLTRNAWTLEKVPFSSPVNGHLLMHVSVAMEGGVTENSFLTMFNDVGGFGAWNRRWCVLGGPFIRYWSYPEDECKKDCIATMDLRMCTTRKVELVSREVCARHHTFQLTFMRPVQAGDKPDLVHEIKDNTLISKILLSADSREERILWCNKLNKALANIRSWDPDALRPEDFQV